MKPYSYVCFYTRCPDNEPRNWNWLKNITQNRIGVTESEAKRLCATFGGKMWQDKEEGN
jgi:hypothetical protein